jgi:hypothetical protein
MTQKVVRNRDVDQLHPAIIHRGHPHCRSRVTALLLGVRGRGELDRTEFGLAVFVVRLEVEQLNDQYNEMLIKIRKPKLN